MDTNTQPQIPGQEPHHHHKIMYTVIGVLLLLLVLGAAALWQTQKETPPVTQQQQTNPTVDWKTYSNTLYGFEFKYPNSFVLDLSINDQFVVIPQDKRDGAAMFYVLPKGFTVSGRTSLFETGVETKDTWFPAGERAREYFGTQDNLTAKIYNLSSRPVGANWENDNEVGYQVTSTNESDTLVLEKILSTFKFTK